MSTTAQEILGSSNSTSMGYIENSTNTTTLASSWLPRDFDTSTGIKTASILLLFIVSLPGNFLLVAVLLKNANKRMRTPSNYFILSMACGDILLTVYSMPQFGILTAYRFRWLVGGVAGEVLCRISFFVGEYSVLVSTGSLLAIALDRLFLVFYPLGRKTTLRTAKYAIAVIWLSSTIFALPSLRLFNTVEIGPGYLLCRFLTYANSPINPWIYFIFNAQFRHGAKLLLMKIFPCCFKALNEVSDVESVGVHVEMEALK
ncbi:orexin receptor type 2-like isoform X2 [Acropora palmata]|uniref:orexin receptor type 2-like isoform X2 n=1 Tax=Acropora palmata TaxID=6131 RepID=UPI003DA13E56